jgi:hypothetical protein
MGLIMRYVENSLKPGKPYRQRKMTNGNCAIDHEKQAKLYMEWAQANNLNQVHSYPDSKNYRTNEVNQIVRTNGFGIRITQVNPEEWK